MRNYRGKRVDNGEWVYGFLAKGVERLFIKPELNTRVIYPSRRNIDDYHDGILIGHWHEVIPETVGQSTGLKDKKDTEWFGSEIITDGRQNLIVVYHCGGYQCYEDKWLQNHAFDVMEALARGFWSIGNVTDNPELMEAK